MDRLFYTLLLYCVAICAIPGEAIAQYSGVEPPKLTHPVTPVYPLSGAVQGDEAWVTIQLRVKSDGTPIDAKAIDGFYSRPFEEAALAAVNQWRFEPAKENGQPIDWADFEVSIPFLFTDIPGGAYPAFTSAYDKVSTLLKQNDFNGAKSAIEDMFAKHKVRLLYEYGFAEIALYRAEAGLGHDQAALKAIYHATPDVQFSEREEQGPELGTRINSRVQLPKRGLVPAEAQKTALRFRFVIDNKLGQYVDALETYDRLAALEKLPPDDPYSKQAAAIRAAFASQEPLAISAKIEGGSWSYEPHRRTISLTNVRGSITSLDFACERRLATLPYQADAEWTLPAAWGRCRVKVNGTDGTEFTLVEFASQSEASH